MRRRLLGIAGFASIGSIKADPLLITVLAVVSAAAAPSAVLDNYALLFWLFVGSCCGVCFVLFGDEKKSLTWRAVLSKLSICFVPGFCITGAGIVLTGATPSAEIVLAASLILSVAGPVIVPMLAKKAGDKVDGAGS